MASAVTTVLPAAAVTVADVLQQLGDVSPQRVRVVPGLGSATERDVLDTEACTGKLCELIDGVLVEKAMGSYESAVAAALIFFLKTHLQKNREGIVLGADGMLRIHRDQVRIPDVAFVSRDRLGSLQLPDHPVLPVVPDLAVEVLSPGNTTAEMERKLQDYFAAGVRAVWYIQPIDRTATIYTSPSRCDTLTLDRALTGGEILPGFELPLRRLFAEAEGRA